jgi:site-specific recombinase XerC
VNGRTRIQESESPRHAVKDIRDSALLMLDGHGLTTGQIVSLDVQDINLEFRVAVVQDTRSQARRLVELSEQDLSKLRKWLACRQLLKPATDAVFVSLHWTDARAKPGQRIGVRGCRQTLRKLRDGEEDRTAVMAYAIAA